MQTDTDLVTALLSTIGRFKRQIRRSAPRGFDGAGLSEAQAELVRLVGRQPGISVSQAAAELGLAANTASTLVSKLSADGLLVRTADPTDRRVGRLQLAESAQRTADDSRNARRSALAGALERLDADELADLTAGLAVLTKLTGLLDERQP
ncbi:MAG: MarR family transcriptional regulator [Mycobacterium sp.]|nr:MarR family transcriptional regulator [Mycobacterium sp.]